MPASQSRRSQWRLQVIQGASTASHLTKVAPDSPGFSNMVSCLYRITPITNNIVSCLIATDAVDVHPQTRCMVSGGRNTGTLAYSIFPARAQPKMVTLHERRTHHMLPHTKVYTRDGNYTAKKERKTKEMYIYIHAYSYRGQTRTSCPTMTVR